MKRFQRYLSALCIAVIAMILGDSLLMYLELPQWVRLPMMAVLGYMLGVEIGNWLNRHLD